jgi:hypothetical protein
MARVIDVKEEDELTEFTIQEKMFHLSQHFSPFIKPLME